MSSNNIGVSGTSVVLSPKPKQKRNIVHEVANYENNKYVIKPNKFFRGSLFQSSEDVGSLKSQINSDNILSLANLADFSDRKLDYFEKRFAGKTPLTKSSSSSQPQEGNIFFQNCRSIMHAAKISDQVDENFKPEPDFKLFSERLLSSLKFLKNNYLRTKMMGTYSSENSVRNHHEFNVSHDVFITSNIKFLKHMSDLPYYTKEDQADLQKCYQSLFEYNLALAKKQAIYDQFNDPSSDLSSEQINKKIKTQNDKFEDIFNNSEKNYHQRLVHRKMDHDKFYNSFKNIKFDLSSTESYGLRYDSPKALFSSVKHQIDRILSSRNEEHNKVFDTVFTKRILNKMTEKVVSESNSKVELNNKLDAIEQAFYDFVKEAPISEGGVLVIDDTNKEDFSKCFKKITQAAGFNDGEFDAYIDSKSALLSTRTLSEKVENQPHANIRMEISKRRLADSFFKIKSDNDSFALYGVSNYDSLKDFFSYVRGQINLRFSSYNEKGDNVFDTVFTKSIVNKMAKQIIIESDNKSELSNKINAIRSAFFDFVGEVCNDNGVLVLSDDNKETFSKCFKKITQAAGLNNNKINGYIDTKLNTLNEKSMSISKVEEETLLDKETDISASSN